MLQKYETPSALSRRICPGLQLQLDARTADERPAGQAAHVELPVLEAYVPDRQFEHVEREDAPIASDAVPTGQPTHVSIVVAAAVTLNVPLPHSVQLSAVPVSFVQEPAGHCVHAVEFARLKYPCLQRTHDELLVSMVVLPKVPAAQTDGLVEPGGQYEPRGQALWLRPPEKVVQ